MVRAFRYAFGATTDFIYLSGVVCEVISCKAFGSVESTGCNTLPDMIVDVLIICTTGAFLSTMILRAVQVQYIPYGTATVTKWSRVLD